MSSAMSSSRFARYLRVGPIMMALGAVCVVGGIVGTTASTNGGNQSCPSGTVLISKYNNDNGYVFEKPAGNENVVTLSHTSSSGGTWHSTIPVSYVIVHGGPNSILYTIAPPQVRRDLLQRRPRRWARRDPDGLQRAVLWFVDAADQHDELEHDQHVHVDIDDRAARNHHDVQLSDHDDGRADHQHDV